MAQPDTPAPRPAPDFNIGPHFIGPAVPCSYCGREMRMYGSRFANTDDGEWHTCAFDTATHRGPMLIDGDFIHLGWRDVR